MIKWERQSDAWLCKVRHIDSGQIQIHGFICRHPNMLTTSEALHVFKYRGWEVLKISLATKKEVRKQWDVNCAVAKSMIFSRL